MENMMMKQMMFSVTCEAILQNFLTMTMKISMTSSLALLIILSLVLLCGETLDSL